MPSPFRRSTEQNINDYIIVYALSKCAFFITEANSAAISFYLNFACEINQHCPAKCSDL